MIATNRSSSKFRRESTRRGTMDEPTRATTLGATPAVDVSPAPARGRSRTRSRSRGTSPARREARARQRERGELPLGGTKAALYYHFRSKEDIVRSFVEDYRAELEQVIAWGASQPRTPGTRAEILRRYTGIVGEQLAVIRFMEQNQATMHTLMSDSGARKKMFRDQFM